jgi:hypothetical protein
MSNKAKARIEQAIKQIGGTNIIVSQISDADRDTFTFWVSFDDKDGERVDTNCKVRNRSINGSIYWKDPQIFTESLPQTPTKAQTISQTTSKSSKEQIIDELSDEVERLRAALEAERKKRG